MSSSLIGCRECGKGFRAVQRLQLFCSNPCRAAFNRRRHDRGAELYDIVMLNAAGPTKGCLSGDLQNLVRAYLDADNALRSGRPSWQPWQFAKTRLPMTYGKTGDGR
jgi:hypothetical protein